MIEVSCENCIFFQGQNTTSGLCRRYASRPMLVMAPPGQMLGQIRDAQRATLWPSVGRRDWCGEFAVAREEPKPLEPVT